MACEGTYRFHVHDEFDGDIPAFALREAPNKSEAEES
jgi:hypothetical protein